MVWMGSGLPFADIDIEILQRLVDIYAQIWVSVATMSDATHEDIRAWKRTIRNKMIDPALEFEGDIFKKKKTNSLFKNRFI